MTLIDHHCHLDFPDLAADLDGVVGRARSAGVGLMVSISMHMRRLADTLAIAGAYPNVFSSVGTKVSFPHWTQRSRLGEPSTAASSTPQSGQANMRSP